MAAAAGSPLPSGAINDNACADTQLAGGAIAAAPAQALTRPREVPASPDTLVAQNLDEDGHDDQISDGTKKSAKSMVTLKSNPKPPGHNRSRPYASPPAQMVKTKGKHN